MEDLGIEQSGLDQLIKEAYSLLDNIIISKNYIIYNIFRFFQNYFSNSR